MKGEMGSGTPEILGECSGDVRIIFYFGQAIRAFVERETLAEATEAFRDDVDSGALLGRRAEIMEFIRSRREGR